MVVINIDDDFIEKGEEQMSHYDKIRDELESGELKQFDSVEKPKHYNVHPSGVQCIEITQHMNFCLGNAVKYLWRAGHKHESPLEDLKKAVWYLHKEIERLEKL